MTGNAAVKVNCELNLVIQNYCLHITKVERVLKKV